MEQGPEASGELPEEPQEASGGVPEASRERLGSGEGGPETEDEIFHIFWGYF